MSHTALSICYHCGSECVQIYSSSDGKPFCCNGCLTAFTIINEHNLCQYYDINNFPGINLLEKKEAERYNFLDNDTIKKKIIEFSKDGISHTTFYIPQIHCSSCLYLLEKLPDIQKGIKYARIDFNAKRLLIAFDEQALSLKEVVIILASLGYEPKLELEQGQDNHAENRDKIIRLGVAGFFFANIMMMSFPEYLNGNPLWEKDISYALRITSLLFSIPVVAYSAKEFYTKAWTALKAKYLSIEVPLVLAIFITFIRSCYELLTRTGSGYLDSLTGIIFFMLLGRFIQDKVYNKLYFNLTYKSFFPIAMDKVVEGKIIPTPIESLAIDDNLIIHNNEWIPVESIVLEGEAYIDYSFITGESEPVTLGVGDTIFAGGRQINGKLKVRITKPLSQNYLVQLWSSSRKQEEKASFNNFIDKLALNFSLFIIIITGFAAFYWWWVGQDQLVWNVISTTLIVACPCVLVLSSSFVYGNFLNAYRKYGIYLRDERVLMALQGVTNIVFDKTGTLTNIKGLKVDYNGMVLSELNRNMLFTMFSQSKHPYSTAITQSLKDAKALQNYTFKELIGLGLEFTYEGNTIKAGSAKFLGLNQTKDAQVYLSINEEIVGNYTITQTLRSGITNMWHTLKNNYSMSIISGDNNQFESQMKTLLGNETEMRFNLSGEEKTKFIKEAVSKGQRVAMVGDGLNDSGAFHESHVGIAIADGQNSFTPASDIILKGDSVKHIGNLLRTAQRANYLIVVLFIYAFIYNFIGLYFALQGRLYPIVAAILMPISSITIIFCAFIGTRIIFRNFENYDQNHRR